MQRDVFRADSMHVAVPRAAGIDVHKMSVTASVRLCEPGLADPLVATDAFDTDPRSLASMCGWLCGHGVTAACMEGTGVYWLAPYRALEDAGIRAELVHAQHVKQLKGRKTDVADSVWLARVCQLGLAQPSFVPSREFAELRQLCRYRRKVVGDRVRVRQRVQKTLDHDGVRVGGLLSDLFGYNGRRILDGLAAGQGAATIVAQLSRHVRGKLEPLARMLEAELSAGGQWRLAGLLRDFDSATRRVDGIDTRAAALLQPWQRQVQLLETVPGVSRASAHAILAEIGPEAPSVFNSAGSLAAWAGVCPGNNESAGKRRSGRIRPGNPHLRAILTECAHGAARTKATQYHAYHRALTARMGYKRAILATAHKLLRTIYALLRDDHPYRDPKVNYERLVVKRNAARWLRKLKEYGFLEPASA